MLTGHQTVQFMFIVIVLSVNLASKSPLILMLLPICIIQLIRDRMPFNLHSNYSFCSKAYIKQCEDKYRKEFCESHPMLGPLLNYNTPYRGDVGYDD